MASKSSRIATIIQQRVVLRASSSSSSSSSSHANTNKIYQQEQRWIRRCRLLDASRGFQPSDDNDDDESSALTTGMKLLSSSTNKKKRPLPTFPLEARHFGGYHGQHLNLSSNKSGDGLSRQPRIQSNNNKNTPKEFHQTLCGMIRNAKERVYIASLYIGPGTSSSSSSTSDVDCEETELLDALSEISNNRNNNNNNNKNEVSIKIILDENRALRPVPIQNNNGNGNENSTTASTATTTSSAEAVDRALRGKGRGDNPTSLASLYLFRVLPSTMIFSDLFRNTNTNTDTGNGNDSRNIGNENGMNWLPNPLNEIAGVFHIKLYLVDDQLILSGANLSVEYFRDRMDRYLHIIQGGNGLVEFYAKLIEILCSHSKEYNKNYQDSETATDSKGRQGGQQHPQHPQPLLRHPNQQQQRETFLRDMTEHFQDPTYDQSSSDEFQSAHDLFTSNHNNSNSNSNSNSNDHNPNRIVAVGIPTFQAPVGFFRHHQHHHHHRNNNNNNDDVNTTTTIGREVVSSWSIFGSLFRINKQPTDKVDFITDVEATLNLLRQAGVMNNDTTKSKSSSNSNSNSNDNNTKSKSNTNYSIQLSSAYLNPTTTLLSILTNGYTKIELLTAGKISHGFKPKEKKETDDGEECNQGKKGKNWTIPSIFQQLVHDCMTTLRSQSQSSMMMDVRLYHWERPKWTFHAKGIWLREEQQEQDDDDTSTATATTNDTSSEVAAVVVGSSNFGYRSFCRDMESNLILVFPPSSSSFSSSTSTASLSNSRSSNEDSQRNSQSNNENKDNTTVNVNINDNENNKDNTKNANTIAHAFGEEWNDLRVTATEQQERDTTTTTTTGTVTAEKQLPPLSWPIRRALPYIKTFF